MTSAPEDDWRWVTLAVVNAIHEQQLARHGGLEGMRDANAVASALARPQNLLAYQTPDGCDLAAAYCFGLARNHGFSDGNKRTAWVVARLFLADNGYRFKVDAIDAVQIVEKTAAGLVSESELAAWFRRHAER